MTIQLVSGDPLLTSAEVMAFGHNRRGKLEVRPLQSELMRDFPAAFSSYRRQCKREKIKSGDYWIWREPTPALMFMVVRETPYGATRLRYVQHIAMSLARDYWRENLTSIAIARLGDPTEWDEIKLLLNMWLEKSSLHVIVYDEILPGVRADETLPQA